MMYYKTNGFQWSQPSTSIEPDQMLHLAVERNVESDVVLSIKMGADVNAKFSQGYTALHISTEKGFTAIARVLCSIDNIQVDSSTDFNMTPLALAIKANKIQIARLLLNHSADPNRTVVFDQSPIHLAAYHQAPEILRVLIRNGADVNSVDCFNQSPLSISILLMPNKKITSTLLEAGSNPNFKSPAKLSLLTEAVLTVNIFKHFRVITTLIDYGADVNERDEIKKETPLHKAASVGHIPLIMYLIENGAELSPRNVYGQTPLDIAKMFSHDKVCRMLSFLEEKAIEEELRALEAIHGRSLEITPSPRQMRHIRYTKSFQQ